MEPEDVSPDSLPVPSPEPVPEPPAPGTSTSSLVASFRDTVQVPDYHLIKRIGSGAYGEVWLAQGITGALRAVKIVWREDFELEKTFHREFEGIKQFEPISRGHPGLVHILHVGWNEEHGFYYYVMELADDTVEGPHITDLQSYNSRTLSSDMKHHGRLDLHFCQEAGAFIADALHYMHERGLTHRDIKPSNIIYCGGVCKLADIGMVAGLGGERAFVGTEGFVPPEGPGTPQADLYSLGKVIYEMSSGKDRMEFPEIPDDLDDSEWPFWLNFNNVICRACAPDLDERFKTCAEFAEALRGVTEIAPPTLMQKVTRKLGKAALFLGASCLLGGTLAAMQHQRQWTYTVPLPVKPPPPSLLPVAEKLWQSSTGLWFSYKKDKARHVADLPVDISLFNSFIAETRPFEGEVVPLTIQGRPTPLYAVVVPAQDADDFCDWFTERERKLGRLPDSLEVTWHPYKALVRKASEPVVPHPGWSALSLELTPVPFASLVITTIPPGAQVYDGSKPLGPTPLRRAQIKAKPMELDIRFPGYKAIIEKITLKAGETKTLQYKLKNISAVIFNKPWENSLHMKLVPLGKVMIGATEVRRRDYLAFVKDRNLPAVPERLLDVTADLDKPVTFVSRADAQAFCEWLTEKEQKAELIEPEHRYRLPLDVEWSMAANLRREVGDDPAERHLRVDGIYPWGYIWPPLPQPKPGNFFDESAAKSTPDPKDKGIEGYNDGQTGVARVGSFRADFQGIADLAGNVWEWVEEDFGGSNPATKSHGTARGGAWDTHERSELLSSFRRALPATTRNDDTGFRVILAGRDPARDED